MTKRTFLKPISFFTLFFFIVSIHFSLLPPTAHANNFSGPSAPEDPPQPPPSPPPDENPDQPPDEPEDDKAPDQPDKPEDDKAPDQPDGPQDEENDKDESGGGGGKIYFWDGREYFKSTDLEIPGIFPIIVGRSYDSKSTYDSPLGYGWSLTYNTRLYENRDGSIVMRTKSGHRYTFVQDGGGYSSPYGVRGRLEENGAGEYTYIEHKGPKQHFDAYGRLTSIEDTWGNRLTMEYDSRGRLPLMGISPFSLDTSSLMIVAYDYRLTRVKEQDSLGQDTGRYVDFIYDETSGRVTTARDHTGREIVYGHDPQGRLISITDPNGNVRSYEYDDPYDMHNITRFIGPRVIENIYDDQDRVIRQVSNNGILDMDYTNEGIPLVKTVVTKTVKDSAGQILHTTDKTYEFDQHGKVTMCTDHAGNVKEYTRDSNGNVISKILYENTGTVETPVLVVHSRKDFTYDTDGNKLTETVTLDSGETVTKTFAYDHNHLASKTVVSSLAPTREFKTEYTFYYDASGYPTRTREKKVLVSNSPEAWLTTGYEYDTNGRLSKVTAPNGDVKNYTYTDGLLTNRDGVTYTYDAWGNRNSESDKLGNTTHYTYDAGNRLVEVENALGEKTISTYSGWNLSQVEYGKAGTTAGKIISFSYDSGNRLTNVTLGTGADAVLIQQIDYDSEDNVLARTDGDGRTLQYAYDERNRLVSIIDPLSHSTLFEYDVAGNLVKTTDANSKITEYSYDDLNRIITEKDALNHTVSYTYDAKNRVLTAQDPNNQTHTYAYDLAGRLVTETRPLGQTFQYFYDDKGRPIRTIDAELKQTVYSYNTDNELMTVQYGEPAQRTVTFTRDANGNIETYSDTDLVPSGSPVRTYTYDDLNRVTTVVDAFVNKTLEYGYDTFGMKANVSLKQDANPIFSYSYTYDDKNRLENLSLAPDVNVNLSHYPSGLLQTITYPNGMTADYTFDPAGRLSALDYRHSDASLIAPLSHTYDNVGSMLSVTDSQGLHQFTYDDTYQVTDATHPTVPAESFTYDAAGNRLSSADHSDWNYDNNNRLQGYGTTSFTYNNNGSVTSKTVGSETTTFDYNSANRLAQVTAPGVSASYLYDLWGQRVEKNANGQLTRFLYDGPNLLAELDNANTVIKYYTYLPGQFAPLAMTEGSNTYYAVNDHLGTPKMLVDGSETVVWSASAQVFGLATVNQDPDGNGIDVVYNIRFPGQYYDSETGLHYNWHRYYDPNTGRYLTADPIGLVGGINIYLYANNNPVSFIDPWGLIYNPLPTLPGASERWPNSNYAAPMADIILGGIEGGFAIAGGIASGVGLLAGPEAWWIPVIIGGPSIEAGWDAYNRIKGGIDRLGDKKDAEKK